MCHASFTANPSRIAGVLNSEYFLLYLRSLAWCSAGRNYWNIFSNDIWKCEFLWWSACSVTANPESWLSVCLFPVLLLLLMPAFFMFFPQHHSHAGPIQTSKQMNSHENSLFSKFFMFRSFKPFRSFSINTSPLSLFSLFICSFCCCFLY